MESSITDCHPALITADPLWTRIQHAIEGSDTVKAHGYLPAIPSHRQDPQGRSSYTERALWYNASARTIDALVGASHRREGLVTVPRQYSPRLSDVTNRGESFHNFCKKVTREVLTFGRYGLMIDVSPTGNHLD